MPNQYVTDDEYGGILDILSMNKKIEFLGWMWPNKQVRPDFESFKKELWQPIHKCLEILLGIRLFITGELQFPVEGLVGDEFVNWWERIQKAGQGYVKAKNYDESNRFQEILTVQDQVTETYRIIMMSAKAGQIEHVFHPSTLRIGPLREECYLSPKHFVKWAIENGYRIPNILGIKQINGRIEWIDGIQNGEGDEIQVGNQNKEKLRAPQKDKARVQEFAKKTWDKYPELTIIDLARHPHLSAEGFLNRNNYTERALRNWVSEIAPEVKKNPGRLPKAKQEKREKICKKLGIKIN
jgi:hypothetical protein